MKSYTKKSVANSVWNDINNCLSDNLVKTLIVLKEEFGFGEKRINQFLNALNDKSIEFDEWDRDEVLDIKTDVERNVYKELIHKHTKETAKLLLPIDVFNDIYSHKTLTRAVSDFKNSKPKMTLKEIRDFEAKMKENNYYECS